MTEIVSIVACGKGIVIQLDSGSLWAWSGTEWSQIPPCPEIIDNAGKVADKRSATVRLIEMAAEMFDRRVSHAIHRACNDCDSRSPIIPQLRNTDWSRIKGCGLLTQGQIMEVLTKAESEGIK